MVDPALVNLLIVVLDHRSALIILSPIEFEFKPLDERVFVLDHESHVLDFFIEPEILSLNILFFFKDGFDVD